MKRNGYTRVEGSQVHLCRGSPALPARAVLTQLVQA